MVHWKAGQEFAGEKGVKPIIRVSFLIELKVKSPNRLRFWFPLIVFCLALTSPAHAGNEDQKFRFDFSVRYRFEAWGGMNARWYGDPGTVGTGKADDKLLFKRIISGLTWLPSKQLTIAAHLQDSRAFGWSLRNRQYPDLFRVGGKTADVPNYRMNPGEEFLEIFDLFVEYRKLLPNISAKLGRQKIFFGDNHIFGPGDWGNTGRWTWDALRLTWQKEKHTIDLFGGGTKVHDPCRKQPRSRY